MTSIAIPFLIPIPSGSFQLGSPLTDPLASGNEKPQSELNLPAFNIGKYPVTNTEYASFIHSTNYDAPPHWNGTHPPRNLLNHPVVNVSIIDVMSYCDWLSQQTKIKFTLPTETQWEKAARGMTDTRRYVWGDDWKSNSCNTWESGIGGTTDVTQYENTNQSPFDVIDMLGNIWEWTKSYYQPLPDSQHDTIHYGNSHHVVRGGSWHNNHRLARTSCRGRYIPGKKRPYLGFRVVSNLIPIDTTKLRQKIKNNFTIGEIKTLCYDMSIAPDEFIIDSKTEFVLRFIVHCEHRKLLQSLIELLKERRPNISW